MTMKKKQTEEINVNVTAIIEGTSDSIWAFDSDYNILYINNVFQKEFHAAFGVWLNKGSSLIEALPEPLRVIWKPRYDRVLSNEQFTVVDEVETAIGKLFIQVTFNPIVKSNEVIGGSCFGSNVTLRMQVEESLRKSEANLRTIIENSPIGFHIYMLEQDNRLVFKMFNYSADKILHVFHEQFIGRDILEAFPALANTGIPEMYIAVAKGELKTQNFEIPYNYEGINGLYDVRVFQGAPGQAVVNFLDITERKCAEDALTKAKEKAEESEARYCLIANNTSDSIWQMDADLRFTYLSPSTEKLFGYSLKEWETLDWNIFVDPEYVEKVLNAFGEIKSGYLKELNALSVLVRHKNGTEIWVEFSASAVFDDNNTLTSIVGVTRDIKERKKNEIDLILAKEKAEESDRLKTAFLQNMSHEIRTPINAIMGFSSLLPENFDNKEKLEVFSKIINQRSEDLLDLINDILDISKIESGQSTLNIEECNINELFSELHLFFRDYQIRTKKQHIELLLQPLNDVTNAIVKTEKIKLKQILVNLISNAFKFTETGTIRCGCEIENNNLKFYVSDTGVGIPKHKFDYIFDRFTQLNNLAVKNIGGTGLGLPIVKGLVGLLGGKVWLESECDKGTTFFFTIDYFPCGVPQKHVFNGVKNNDGIFINKTILIVEDDLYNAMYLNEILKNNVANICTVNNGADAIEFAKNNTVDVILMDVRLPDITGYEATKEILKHNPAIIVIAQTAYAAQDEHQKALSNGCVDYISKPTKQEQLLTILRKHLK